MGAQFFPTEVCMSRKSFNAYGVPWYARSDTPAIRGNPNPPEPTYADWRAKKAAFMNAVQARIRQCKENWKEGDRFLYVSSNGAGQAAGDTRKVEYIAYSGTFLYAKQQGAYWFVTVQFDDTQKRKGGSKFGMGDFLNHAHKWDDGLAAEIPIWGEWWENIEVTDVNCSSSNHGEEARKA